MRMKNNDTDEFFVGYLPNMPAHTAKLIRKATLGMIALAALLALAFSLAQPTFYPSVFEFGNTRKFQGVIAAEPYPQLQLLRPALGENNVMVSRYYLVAPFKYGADQMIAPFVGQAVELEGTLIYRDNQTMIEIVKNGIRKLNAADSANVQSYADLQQLAAVKSGQLESLGELTFRGEIVDSKCYFGVMNPGQGKLHRDCAVRCISGGIPPVLMVRDQAGSAAYLMLVDRNGAQVNRQVLPLVADYVQITGEVLRKDNLLILKADPNTIQRIR